MSNSKVEEKQKSGRCRKPLFVALGLTLLGLAVLAGYARSRFSVFSAYTDYPAAAKAYRDSGLPWIPEDLTGPTLPDEQNAAAQYRLIGQGGTPAGLPSGPSKPSLPQIRGLLTKQDLPDVEAYLKLVEPELAKLPALQKLDCQWNTDWAEVSFAIFPECAQLKAWTKELCLRAEVKMLKGDSQGAAEDLKLAAGLAKDLEEGFTIIHVLSGSAAEAIVLASARKCATMAPSDGRFLNRMIELSDMLSEPIRIKNVIKGEAFLNLQMVRYLNVAPMFLDKVQKGPAAKDSSPKAGPDVQGFVNQSYASRLLRKWTALYSMLGKEPEEDLAAFQKSLPVEMEEWQDEEIGVDQWKELPKAMDADYMASMTQTSWSPFVNAILQARARALTHRVLFSLALSEVFILDGPPLRVPLDPFGDGALKSRISSKEIKVWSIGPDRDNDAGVERILDPNAKPMQKGDPPRPVTPPNGDIVAELPWKPSGPATWAPTAP